MPSRPAPAEGPIPTDTTLPNPVPRPLRANLLLTIPSISREEVSLLAQLLSTHGLHLLPLRPQRTITGPILGERTRTADPLPRADPRTAKSVTFLRSLGSLRRAEMKPLREQNTAAPRFRLLESRLQGRSIRGRLLTTILIFRRTRKVVYRPLHLPGTALLLAF